MIASKFLHSLQDIIKPLLSALPSNHSNPEESITAYLQPIPMLGEQNILPSNLSPCKCKIYQPGTTLSGICSHSLTIKKTTYIIHQFHSIYFIGSR